MAYTLTQYTALKDCIASGERKVRYDGKEVEYQDTAQMQRALAQIEAELVATGQLAAPNVGGLARGDTTFAAYSAD